MAARAFTRGISFSLTAAVGIGVCLAACGHPATQEKAASGSYDIARVNDVQNDFPQGFTVTTHPPKTLAEQDIDKSGVDDLTSATLDPPQCLAAILPSRVDPSPGTRAAGIYAEGESGGIAVVALQSPTPAPKRQPPAGCDRVSISGSPDVTGTAESIPAPQIEGVTTSAVKLTTGEKDPEYIFTAELDDYTYVVVRGGTDADANPQQLMPDLLVKATAAVRRQ